MLFKQWALDGIASGEIDLAFRSWRRPTVKIGTRMRTAIGVVEIDRLDAVDPASIPASDVHRAGFSSREALQQSLRPPSRASTGGTTSTEGDATASDRVVYRIELHLAGPDPRQALREQADLTPEETAYVSERLERLDKASRHGPWTKSTLRVIADHPATRAGDLAAQVGRPRDKFKTDVRKLKELGLTESLGTGYRLSPRGRAFLEGL